MISERIFDVTKDGNKIICYKIESQNGFVEILNYGGIIRSLVVPDKDGKSTDVVIGFDCIQEYIDYHGSYFGALIGRCANRIACGRFTLNGKEYQLAINNRENHLHGGIKGYGTYIWDVDAYDPNGNALVLHLFDPDMRENYPGNVNVTVTYSFTDDNELTIDYKAVSDKDTVFNPTNHSYFNLNGAGSGTIYNHYLEIYADYFTPINSSCLPTGEIKEVTPAISFKSGKTLADGLIHKADDPDIVAGGGYDCNYVLDHNGEMKLTATAIGDISGIKMHVYTTQPGIQLYSGNFMKENILGKNNKTYGYRHAFCLETQFAPDSINHPTWDSPVLKENQPCHYITKYVFPSYINKQ